MEPYSETICPVVGCTHGPFGGPQFGKTPGVKRHVVMVHKLPVEDFWWPPIHVVSVSQQILDAMLGRDDLEAMSVRELRALAGRRGSPAVGIHQ